MNFSMKRSPAKWICLQTANHTLYLLYEGWKNRLRFKFLVFLEALNLESENYFFYKFQ